MSRFLEAIQLSCSSFAWREVFAKIERKRGGKGSKNDNDFFFFSLKKGKEGKKLGIFFFFPSVPLRLSFANSVSHRPRVKQKTGKEIIAPFPGKIYFRESASDKVLDKVPLWMENKNPSREELKR